MLVDIVHHRDLEGPEVHLSAISLSFIIKEVVVAQCKLYHYVLVIFDVLRLPHAPSFANSNVFSGS